MEDKEPKVEHTTPAPEQEAEKENKNLFNDGFKTAFSSIDEILKEGGIEKVPGKFTSDSVKALINELKELKAQKEEVKEEPKTDNKEEFKQLQETYQKQLQEKEQELQKITAKQARFLQEITVNNALSGLSYNIPEGVEGTAKEQYTKTIKSNISGFVNNIESKEIDGKKFYLKEDGSFYTDRKTGNPKSLKDIITEERGYFFASKTPQTATRAKVAEELKYTKEKPSAKSMQDVYKIVSDEGIVKMSPEYFKRVQEIKSYNGLTF